VIYCLVWFVVDINKWFNTVATDYEPTVADPHDPYVGAGDCVVIACNVTLVFKNDLDHDALLSLAILLGLEVDLREAHPLDDVERTLPVVLDHLEDISRRG
jgi:hypothetical protein